jgi:6-phosphogluconolactonase
MVSELLIGTYTQSLPHVDGKADGILSARLDGHDLVDVALAAKVANPSWVTATTDGSRVYAAIETEPVGAVAAFSRSTDGVLTPLGQVTAGGAAPANLTLDPSERFVVVGTYGGGSFSVYRVGDDGSLGERAAFVQHEGSGPDESRQEGPHVHQLSFDPITGDLVVVDLGLGEIRFYAFGADGSVALRPEATVSSGAAGPRHLAFHPSGAYAFVANELHSTVDVLRRDGDRFVLVGSASTRPADASGENAPAAVRVSGSGSTVFVTNRGDDTVAVLGFAAGADAGAAGAGLGAVAPVSALSLVATIPSRGAGPRDLVLSPEGDRVLVANQDGGIVAVFSWDESTRTMELLSVAEVPTPVCLHFV